MDRGRRVLDSVKRDRPEAGDPGFAEYRRKLKTNLKSLSLLLNYQQSDECLRELVAVANAPPELRERFTEDPNRFAETIRIECDCVFAVGTSDIIVTLKPTDGLSSFVSAMGALKIGEVKLGQELSKVWRNG